MKTRAGRLTRSPRKCSPGFSLVELLLAVALILVLLGAVVFNFSNLQQNAALDEGATQFESLIRYLRAHASNTGRKVRLSFEEDAGGGLLVPLGNLAVAWEPDPLGQPNEFAALPETADFVKSILDVISIENVRPVATGFVPAASSAEPGSDVRTEAPVPVAEPSTLGFPPIYFYPDGSCDAAEVIIASRNGEDSRRIVLRLAGLTGAVQRRTLVTDAASSPPETSDAPAAAAAPEKVP